LKNEGETPLRRSDAITEKIVESLVCVSKTGLFRKAGGGKLHLGGAGMRGYDFPPVVKFLENQATLLLGTRKRDLPAGEG
jgi:hypothetical protein